MKRVMVTGATGFVGYQSLAPLVSRGYEVIAVSSSESRPDAPSGVQWIAADLMDEASIATAMERHKPSYLLHFAWYAEPGLFWSSKENLGWVQASASLLRHFARCGGQRIVSAGTCAEYDWTSGLCTEDRTPLSPTTLYGISKHAVQTVQQAFCREMGISQAWGRIFLVYGPRERESRLVASVVTALLAGRRARCSAGSQIRDLMHVGDVGEAFASLLDSSVEGPINIASGASCRIREAVQVIAALIGREDLVELGAVPTSAGEPHLLVADTRRREAEMDWAPRFDLASGLADTVSWWRNQLRSTTVERPAA